MTWRGRILLQWLKVEIGSGGVDIGIMGMPGQDELGSHKSFATRHHERRIQSTHSEEYVIIRVVQLQHGGTTMRLARDLIITALHSSMTFRDELTTAGGDHADLPLGFSESLMEWGTFGTCTEQDSEWNDGSFTLDRMT